MAMCILRQRLSRFVLVPTLAIVLVVGFAAGLGYTAVRANSSNVVEACVNRYTGAVRMNQGNVPLNCSSGETKRTWDGVDNVGLTGVQIVTADVQYDNQTTFSLPAYCPAGTQIIGGGAATSSSAYHLTDSHPNSLGNYWIAETATDGAASTVFLVVYAICAQFDS